MPTYVYECCGCSARYEKRQRMSDEPDQECPECGGQVRRVIFPVGIIFKGPGFYATDNARSSAAGVGTGIDKSNGDKSETESADSKKKCEPLGRKEIKEAAAAQGKASED